MKLISAFFILFLTFEAFACEVKLPHALIILGDAATTTNFLENQDCSPEALQELNQIISGVEGRVPTSQLTEILNSKGHEVKITPHLINVQQLKALIREQISLPAGVHVKALRALNSANFISLAPGDKVEVQCIGCLFGQQQPLNLVINGFDGIQKSLTVVADFKKMVKAHRVLSFLPAFTDITPSMVQEVYVESIPQTGFVTNSEHLRFYKTNKPIKAGELLKQADLNAINLVKAGLRTEVIIENHLIRLKTHGISRNTGTLGEFVEVFHPQKNKKYQGKVIDINKVLVEL